MNHTQLDPLSRAVFRHLAQNVRSWREVPIDPDAPEELEKSPGYKQWRRAKFQKILLADRKWEANRRLIMDAEWHLEDMGYRCASIRSPKPGHASVRVANAGSWRLCVRIPEDIAERIIILGFVPKI